MSELDIQVDLSKMATPKEHKAKILVWTDLKLTDLDILEQLTTADEIKEQLKHIFCLADHDPDRSAIILDLYYYTLQFARDSNFTKEQTSAYFSIIKAIHDVCTETPFGNVQETHRYFKDLVICHSVKRPPFSIDIFTPDQAKKIVSYVTNTYFRHFKLYKYAFTLRICLDLSIMYPGRPSSAKEAQDEELEEDNEKEKEEDEEEETELPGEETESEAASELRKLIKLHLTEEIKKLKESVDNQIKQSEQEIEKKIKEVEKSSSPRQRNTSSRHKKK